MFALGAYNVLITRLLQAILQEELRVTFDPRDPGEFWNPLSETSPLLVSQCSAKFPEDDPIDFLHYYNN